MCAGSAPGPEILERSPPPAPDRSRADRVATAISTVLLVVVILLIVDGLVWCFTLTTMMGSVSGFFQITGGVLLLPPAAVAMWASFFARRWQTRVLAWLAGVLVLLYLVVIREVVLWYL